MLVLDANILMRAVLGKRVRLLPAKYRARAEFVAPDVAFVESAETFAGAVGKAAVAGGTVYVLPRFAGQRGANHRGGNLFGCEAVARQRLALRDEDDWHIPAAALTLRCPIWTEATDFFGSGVATWTWDRVELFLIDAAAESAAGE